jgi:hypothetical protein
MALESSKGVHTKKRWIPKSIKAYSLKGSNSEFSGKIASKIKLMRHHRRKKNKVALKILTSSRLIAKR